MGWSTPRLPQWTSHPGFGVVALLVTGVLLVIHGEPQPSNHPSGTSIVVNDTSPAPVAPETVLVIRGNDVESRHGTSIHRVGLPQGVRPVELVPVRGATVLLGVRGVEQRAWLIDQRLHLVALGPADGVVAAAASGAAIVETAVGTPGRIGPLARPTSTVTSSAPAVTSSTPKKGDAPLPNFTARRIDTDGHAVGPSIALPDGSRLATDSPIGLIVWHPQQPLYDNGVALEPKSAQAMLIRPDRTMRLLGPVHPLAASAHELLVWDVVQRRFGLMPLMWVDSTATTTDQATPSETGIVSSSRSVTPSASPTEVAGVRWYVRNRGIVVTGPASFSPDGSAFAVYAQVGARRRLVVARTDTTNVASAEVAVLALAAPTVKVSPGDSATSTDTGSASSSQSDGPASPTDSGTAPIFADDGFPVTAPLTPCWWDERVVGVGTDGTVIGYVPGTNDAKLVDLGVRDIVSLASTG